MMKTFYSTTQGANYKVTITKKNSSSLTFLPLYVLTPVVSTIGNLTLATALISSLNSSDIYITITIMKATGEYVDGVVIGPKTLLQNQRFPINLQLPIESMKLTEGVYYISMDAGDKQSREIHQQEAFVVINSNINIQIDKNYLEDRFIVQTHIGKPIHFKFQLKFSEDNNINENSALDTAYVFFYKQDVKTPYSSYSIPVETNHDELEFFVTCTHNETLGKYYVICEIANVEKKVVASCFTQIFFSSK